MEWLGEVPEHWTIQPLWTYFRRSKRTGFDREELLSVYRDYGVVPKASREDNFNKPSDDLSAYQLVEPGDLAINKMKAWQGSVAVSTHRGIVSPAYFVYVPLHSDDSQYLHYLLRSSEYTAGYLTLSKGIRPSQWDLEPQSHSRMPLLIPPVAEQHAIRRFLDQQTAQIDTLVAEQQRLIKLLQEKRHAIIARAITKGLNPEVHVKASGVEWIGDIPAHWRVAPLYTEFDAVLGKMLDDKAQTGRFAISYLRNADVQWDRVNISDLPTIDIKPDEFDRYTLCPGDVLICEGGAGVGQTAIWHGELQPCAFQKALHRVRPRSADSNPRLLYYVMRAVVESGAVFTEGNTSTIPHLTSEKLRALRIPLPGRVESGKITAFLDGEMHKLDALIVEASGAIALLRERRSALVSAAVTGKIDVRNYAADQAEAA